MKPNWKHIAGTGAALVVGAYLWHTHKHRVTRRLKGLWEEKDPTVQAI